MIYLTTRAPAKVNLVLRVGSKRPDGYHDIESLMVPLALADEVEVRVFPGRRGGVSCLCPGHPELEGIANLATRAALAFRERFGFHDRCDIRLMKRIPVTAGLGGGSSDAASVLRCLSRAYSVRDAVGLLEAGLSVGSDVPFFLGSGAAWARGRGEVLEPTRVPALHLVLVHPCDPSLAIRAADAYRWLDEIRSDHPDGSLPRDTRAARRPHPFRVSDLVNDLQDPCFSRHPSLVGLVGRLEALGASAAIMSGSGPTVFGLFADRRRALAAELALLGRSGGVEATDVFTTRVLRKLPGVSSWKSPRSAYSWSTRKSSRPT
jgi:4-diphosphocytidyl-2-C-methyl-D-erythritol kinase